MASSLQMDPTRTTPLRARYLAAMGARVAALRKAVRGLVVADDAFGLVRNAFITNAEDWAFETDPGKVAAFREWLDEQFQLGLLYGDTTDVVPWANHFIYSAYKAGVLRAFADARPKAMARSEEFYAGTREQFLFNIFNGGIAANRLELLYTRNFELLRGVTADMASKLSRILADGLAHGHGPARMARAMVLEIEGISKRRAMKIARTEIIYAFAEGQLDAFESLGIEKLGVFVEVSTAGDERVCPICAAEGGKVYTIAEARGVIPYHPDCRCCWVPYLGDALS